LRALAVIANELEDTGDLVASLEWRRAALWVMRDMSPRPHEHPKTDTQRRWLATWVSTVTEQMVQLADAQAALATFESLRAAAAIHTEIMAFRMPQFGEGGTYTLVSFFSLSFAGTEPRRSLWRHTDLRSSPPPPPPPPPSVPIFLGCSEMRQHLGRPARSYSAQRVDALRLVRVDEVLQNRAGRRVARRHWRGVDHRRRHHRRCRVRTAKRVAAAAAADCVGRKKHWSHWARRQRWSAKQPYGRQPAKQPYG
jgi:hypothetical protein